MKNKLKRTVIIFSVIALAAILILAVFCIFFDEAFIARKGTIYCVRCADKVVALTFDDGPSPVWTPKILDELKKAGVKATFFMVGEHVKSYPEIARRVKEEGHEIGNHTYDHHVLIYYKDYELEKEINDAQAIIKDVTGADNKYFRPPKAWLTNKEKKIIKDMGYKIILWSLNAKDWVKFDDKYIARYIVRNAHSGDIILFHDSGGVFATVGGDRSETVKTIPLLVHKLKEKGYRFVTITQLLENGYSVKK